jgi:hypothetical protein
VLLALALPCAKAQAPSSAKPATAKPDSFLGLHLEAVPEVLYFHLPKLQRGLGILVDQVKLSSPADKAGLKRYDLIVAYNGTCVKSTEELACLIRADKPERTAALMLIRNGKSVILDVNLVTACKLADAEATKNPRGAAKVGRPPAINVLATPVGSGKMEVTFAFVPEGKTKEQRVTYTGSLDQIEAQVQALPVPVQDFAKVALSRLRTRKAK